MSTTLIVARLSPDRAAAVSEVFAASDATDLPLRLGVRRRTLFTFHGLYFHLVEADGDMQPRLAEVRDDPLWREVNDRLAEHVRPFDPETWRSPKDAMAQPFYEWSAQ